jgi:hypothetical protein
MKKLISLILLIVLVLPICGCGGSNSNLIFENKYVENQDNQYMYQSGVGITTVQQGDNIYYYLHNHFLYLVDEENYSVNPICNKTDCLHEKETIPDKVSTCNAYIDNYGPDKIQYYDGNIYYISSETIDDETVTHLKKFNISTQSKDIVFTFKTDIGEWIIHRGYFYYEDTLAYKGDDECTGSVDRVALDKSEKDSEILFDFDKSGLSLFQTSNMQAYGNFVYYDAITAQKGISIDDLDSDDDMLGKRYCYNIESGEQICLNDVIGKNTIPYYGFYNNKIIFGSYETKDCNIYTCDLDGKNIEKLFTYDKKLRTYTKFSDGKYFYFENTDLALTDENYKSTYLVYNFKGEKINTVKMPFDMSNHIPFDNNYIIRSSDPFGETVDNDKLYLIDKSKIGSSPELKAKSIYKFN